MAEVDIYFLKKQKLALTYLRDEITVELLYGGGAGGGKSVLGCYWLITQSIKYPGTRWLMGRAVLKSLKETTLNTFFDVAKMLGLGGQYKYNQQNGVIYMPNNSEIMLRDLATYPSDPNFDSLGSLEITGAFIDECNQITEKAKNIVKSRIRYKLDEYNLRPKMLMTCNPAKNWTYTEFYRKDKKLELEPTKKFIQALATENPHISQHYIANLRTLDKASKARLLHGDWEYDDDPSTLMEYDKIIDIFTNTFVDSGEKYITGDIARFGDDKTVILAWDGWKCIDAIVLNMSSIPESVAAIEKLRDRYKVPLSNIAVDEDGVGGGVKDLLRCNGFVNNSKALDNPVTRVSENYNNLKSQCYFKLADLVNKGLVYVGAPTLLEVEIKQHLIEELEQVKRANMDADRTLQVVDKKKVKEVLGRSPDYSDALMIRAYFEYKKKQSWHFG